MKLVRILFYVFLLITLPVNSLAFTLQSTEYNSGDTFVAIFDGQIQANSARVFDFAGNLLRLGILGYSAENLSFVYFDIPLWMQGNYTFSYGQESSEFKVSEGPSIAIKPIAIYTSQAKSNAKIDLINKNDYAIAVNAASSPGMELSRNSISVPALSTRNLFVSWDKKLENASVQISYDSGKRQYNIPIIFTPEPAPNETISLMQTENAESVEPEPIETGNPEIRIAENIALINHTIPRTKMINGSLHFIATQEIKNARFHLTPGIAEIVTLNATGFPIMEPGVEYEQYIWINKYRNFAEGRYSGVLSLDADDGTSASVNIEITLTKPESASITNNSAASKPNTTRPSFNSTNINLTIINYTEQARLERERIDKNFRLGILLVAIFLIVAAIIIYAFRPKPKKISMNEYLTQVKTAKKK